ncbi:MAG: hypothetical protein WCO94_03850 [Verrucomicrobiota bacterium]
MNKPLFTKLIKAWHPDLTTNLRQKIVCEEMTKYILCANEAGDDVTLREIERLGEGYLEVAKERALEAEEERRSDADFEEIRRRFYEMQAAESRGTWAYAIPIIPPRPRYLVNFLWMINPYLLAFSVSEWRENGRLHNAWALCNAAGWSWILLQIWIQVGTFEAASLATGHAQSGAMGLLFVLLRGVLIVVALPVAVPLAMFVGGAAIIIGTIWLAAWIAGGVLGFFHPWLTIVPIFIAGIVLIAAAWAALGEDL